MLKKAKINLLPCIGYLRFIKDLIKLDSLQTLVLAQLRNFQNYLLLASLLSKLKLYNTVRPCMKGQGENLCWSIKNSIEVLSKLKDRGFQATCFVYL